MKKLRMLSALLLVAVLSAGGWCGAAAAEEGPRFVSGGSGASFSAETVQENGAARGVLLRASGGAGTVLDAVWTQELAPEDLKLRLDLTDAGLWSGTEALGYLEISLTGGGMTLAVRLTPMTASVYGADVFVADGDALPEGAQPVSVQNMVSLTRTDGGEDGILGLSVYTTQSLLDLSVDEWNLALNSLAFTALKDYDGETPPVSNADKKDFAEGEIKRFLDGAKSLRVGICAVNGTEEDISVSILAEQVGQELLYDVRTSETSMYVEPNDLGYQKLTLRWTIPEDSALCGGIVLRRYENGTLTKTQTFATVERLTYEDIGLSQKRTYLYTMELVDNVSQPVPKIYYRFEDFEIQPKQGQPWIVVGVAAGVVAVCVAFVLAYTFLPRPKKRMDKKDNG